MDWLDLLAVQGTLKSLLHTTVQKHQFFGTQLSPQSNSHIHTQERAVEEVKLAIKPFYQKREVTKEEYKDILRKAVQKVGGACEPWAAWPHPTPPCCSRPLRCLGCEGCCL